MQISNPLQLLKSVTSAPALTLSLLSLSTPTDSVRAATLYTDLETFNAKTSGITNIDFEGVAPQSDRLRVGSYYINSGVYFTSILSLDVVDSHDRAYTNWGSGASLSNKDRITARLPAGVTAVGGEIFFDRPACSTFKINITYSNGIDRAFDLSSANFPTRQFVGFTSDETITSIEFISLNSNYSNIHLDNFKFGTINTATAVV
jgi:hypothetical protein